MSNERTVTKPLTSMEQLAVVKILRAHRAEVIQRRELLIERNRTFGGDIYDGQALHAIDNELWLVDNLVRKMWEWYLIERQRPP